MPQQGAGVRTVYREACPCKAPVRWRERSVGMRTAYLREIHINGTTERFMSNTIHDNIFEKAIQIAKKSTMLQKHGAVILSKNGDIIGQGYNHFSDYMSHQWSCHAEMAALMNIRNKKGRERVADATLLVVRIGNDGLPKLSKPCENCKREIEKFGIKRVFYSA